MTANSPAESSLYPRPNDDCITAELVSVTESKSLHQNAAGNLAALSGENTVFEPSVTEIPVTESFEFNYLNFGGSPPPQSPQLTFRQLVTPWSSVGLLLFLAANLGVGIHLVPCQEPAAEVKIAGFETLPPVATTQSLALQSAAQPSLTSDTLSQFKPLPPDASRLNLPPSLPAANPVAQPPQVSPQPPQVTVPTTPQSPVNPAPPPEPTVNLAARLLPPAVNPAPAPLPPAPTAPQYSQAAPPMPTVAVRPAYQTQQANLLPPPPPPPVQASSPVMTAAPPSSNITPPSGQTVAPNPTAILPATAALPATANPSVTALAPVLPPVNSVDARRVAVENQMKKQLPSRVATPASTTPETQPYHQRVRGQLTRQYNRSAVSPNSAASSQTQQLIQELEGLNQAP